MSSAINRKWKPLAICSLFTLLISNPTSAKQETWNLPFNPQEETETSSSQPIVPSPLTLERAIQIAQRGNADLLAARTALEEVRARILSAGAYPNPEVAGEYAPSVPSATDRSLTIGIEQPISIRNKISKRVNLATTELERDEWFVRDLERSIAAQVRSSYRTAQMIDQRMQLSKNLADLNLRLLEVAGARFGRGEVSELDVRQFEIELAQREQEVESLSTLRRSSLIELSLLLNIPYQEELSLAAELAGERKSFPVEPFLEAASERPDLKGIKMEVVAAGKEVSLRMAERWGDPRIGLFFTRERAQFDDPITITDTDNIVGARISIPIPLWYKNQGEIVQARARELTAGATLQAQELTVDREVRDAHQRAMAQLKIIRGLEQGVEAADKGKRLAELAYSQGLINAVQFIQTQQQLFNIKDFRLDALDGYYTALSDLEGAVGASMSQVLGEYQEDLEP